MEADDDADVGNWVHVSVTTAKATIDEEEASQEESIRVTQVTVFWSGFEFKEAALDYVLFSWL